MPVNLQHGCKPLRRSPRNRRNGYNKKVREFAPLFLKLQADGIISAGHIADVLRETSLRTSRGDAYAESVIFGMLRRAQELGFPVIRRTRSQG